MLIKKKLEYLGIDNPDTISQINVEIFGLKQVIKVAEEMISRLEQAVAIVELNNERVKTKEDEKKD